MMKNIIFFLLSGLFTLNLTAQNLEIGAKLGGMMYTGDLDPGGWTENFKNIKGTYGLHMKYNVNSKFAFRVDFNKGSVIGRDSISETQWRVERNLSFRSDITEFSFMIENNFFGFNMGTEEKSFSPYFFLGVSYYIFNPQALYNGQLVALQPLGTEGQGLAGMPAKYSLKQYAIPIGGGLKYQLTRKLSLSFEGNIRFLFTDHLDDVSGTYPIFDDLFASNGQVAVDLSNRVGEVVASPPDLNGEVRGNADVRDYFMTGAVSVSYYFTVGSIFGGSDKVGCPTW